MNFDDAIKAHSAWKQKLSAYLAKPDGSIKPTEVEKDHVCALGQWIHGEAKNTFGNDPDYTKLKGEHARFHKAAAEVVRKADSGKSVSEDVAIGAKSDFGSASTSVVGLLMSVKRKFTQAA